MKKLLFIIFAFISLTAHAQEMPIGRDQFYSIENFSDMLKSHVSPYLVKEGSATEALNVNANDEYGSISKRNKRLKLSECHAAPVKSLYRFYKSDDSKYIIQTSSTYVDYVSDEGVCTSLYASASDGRRWSWITYKDMAIGMNGTNNAKKWDGSLLATANTDGHRTAGDLITDLGAPFAELNTGANLDSSSWYQYKVAYYNGSTYSFSSSRSNPILTGSSVRDIYLTDIPLGPEGTTQRIIYRTLGNASRAAVVADTTFYKVAAIADNSTTVYADAIPDTTIDDNAAPTWATVSAGTEVTPPKAKYSLINKERLFIANDPSGVASGKSTIYWSKSLRPDYFDFYNDYELIRPDDGDEITFIKNLLGIMTVGKTRTISKVYTDVISSGSSSTFTVTPSEPFSFIGCVSPFSAINTINGIMYLGRYGLYVFNGQNSLLISDVVTDRIKDVLETNIEEAVSTFSNGRYILAYTSSSSGSSVNDKVLAFNITRDAYTEETGNIDSFSVHDGGNDSGVLFSGSSNTDGIVYAHGEGYSDLTYRYKSQIQSGTSDSIYIGGTEESPLITLGNSDTWADEGTETWEGSGSKTWIIEDLTGEWYSPIVQINASALDKLYWNESLGSFGNITFAIRTGATSVACAAAAWSSELSSPSGSDISALTANVFIQIRASLSSSSYIESPALLLEDYFVVRLSYKKNAEDQESSYLSMWQGGMTKLGSDYPKRLKEIQVFYTGTEGTLSVYFTNSEGITRSFNIDLSISPSASTTDSYFGTNTNKIYTYILPFNISATGRQFQFKVLENGTEQWKVQRIVVRYDTNPYATFGGGL